MCPWNRGIVNVTTKAKKWMLKRALRALFSPDIYYTIMMCLFSEKYLSDHLAGYLLVWYSNFFFEKSAAGFVNR